MNAGIRITVLIDNLALHEYLSSEHGLSVWVEYQDKCILFDTGQSDLLLSNAKLLGVDLTRTDAIVISHGHYDHTGGLEAVLKVAPHAFLYAHPDALMRRFSRKQHNVREIGMSVAVKEIVKSAAGPDKIIWTEKPTEVFPGFFATGPIPRRFDFEEDGGSFFTDQSCHSQDAFPDDQAVFIESPRGLIIILGCAHAGVANTLYYVARLRRRKTIYAVLGGMHLAAADDIRIRQTIDFFRQYDVQRIGLAHCTGENAAKAFMEAFPQRAFICSSGMEIHL